MTLKPKELQVLRLLAEGFNYREIAKQMGEHRAEIHLICHFIRQKTGIESTKSMVQCKSWLAENPDPTKAKPLPSCKPPTPKQMRAMELYAVYKKSFDQIAWEMGINQQGAQNHLVIGMNRARIKPRDWTGDRRPEICAYLKSVGFATPQPASKDVNDY